MIDAKIENLDKFFQEKDAELKITYSKEDIKASFETNLEKVEKTEPLTICFLLSIALIDAFIELKKHHEYKEYQSAPLIDGMLDYIKMGILLEEAKKG
jgi:hypothetical protein